MKKELNWTDDFSSLSDEAWKEKIMADLKGKDFSETLVWKDEQGVTHQPYYRQSNLDKKPLVSAIQEQQKKEAGWKIAHCFSFQKNQTSIESITKNALDSGVDKVIICDIEASEADAINENNSEVGKRSFYLSNFPNQTPEYSFYIDPFGQYLKSGKKVEDYKQMLLSLFQSNSTKSQRFLMVDSSLYKSAGSSIFEEMAYTLQHALFYFDLLTEAGVSAQKVADSMIFKFSFGNSYFTEIAKARALRYLITKLYDAYEISATPYIWGSGNLSYMAHKDPYTNLLRNTTQSMSAIIGNCDMISTLAFDELQEPSSLGNRMAKNIQLILSEEAYLSQVADMAAGSYYLESLSADLAEKSWTHFLGMEKAGGIEQLFETGALQKELDSSHQKQMAAYKNGGKVMLGVNQFLNPEVKDLEVKQQKTAKGLKTYIVSTEITQ